MSVPAIFPILASTGYLHENTKLLVNQMAAYLPFFFFFKLPPSLDPHLTVCAVPQQLRMKLIAKLLPQGLKPNYFTCFLINHYSELVFTLQGNSFPLESSCLVFLTLRRGVFQSV